MGGGSAFILTWVVGTLLLIILDLVWFRIMGKYVYLPYLKGIMRPSPRLTPAVIAWLLVSLGNLLLILVTPIISLRASAVVGGFYGFIIFGIYNSTNGAIVKNWSLLLALVDIGWGIVVNASLALIMRYLLYNFLA